MVFLIELLLIIILFLVFLSFKVNDSAHIKISILFYIFFIFGLIIFFLFKLNSFSKLFSIYDFIYLYRVDIFSNDLYLIFYYYFVQSPVIVLCIGVIIALMSIIFSAIYFCVRYYKSISRLSHKAVCFIRRQQLIKQSNYR